MGDGTWTPMDRAKALALREYRRAVCPQCGTREDEWDPDLGGDPEAYIASTRKCFGCEEIHLQQKSIPDGAAGAGMKVLLMPTAVVAALKVQQDMASSEA